MAVSTRRRRGPLGVNTAYKSYAAIAPSRAHVVHSGTYVKMNAVTTPVTTRYICFRARGDAGRRKSAPTPAAAKFHSRNANVTASTVILSVATTCRLMMPVSTKKMEKPETAM